MTAAAAAAAAQKHQSPKHKKKTTKGSSRSRALEEDHKKLLLIAIAIVYVVAFAIGCVPFFMAHYSSRHVVLSDHTTTTATPAAAPKNNNSKNGPSVTLTIQQPDGRVTHQVASLLPAGEIPKEALAALQQHILPLQRKIALDHGQVEGIRYYRCANLVAQNINDDQSTPRDAVILDGGTFLSPDHFSGEWDKKDLQASEYKEGTFLDLCSVGLSPSSGGLTSIVALDTTFLEPSQLLRVVQGLRDQHKIVSLPLAAIITPGRSAATIAEWILYGDLHSLPRDLAQHWIPVSPVWDEDLAIDVVGGDGLWPVLALHGQETSGTAVTDALLQLRHSLGAVTYALPGGDDCYLEHPKDFAMAVLGYLTSMRKTEHPKHQSSSVLEDNAEDNISDHPNIQAAAVESSQ